MKKDKHCTICGKLLFLPTGNQKYCMDCANKVKGNRQKADKLKRKMHKNAGQSFEELEIKARELGLSYGKYMGLRRLGKI